MTAVTATPVRTTRRTRILDVTLAGTPLGRVRVATGRTGAVPSLSDVQRVTGALYRVRWGAYGSAHTEVWDAVTGTA